MGLFGFLTGSVINDELPNIFPLAIAEKDFVRIDVLNIYSKILTDVIERSQGLSQDEQSILWDNCLASERAEGLITLISRAMYDKSELFLVYDKATKILRKATGTEEAQIRADYAKQAESAVGVYVSFAKFIRSDMIRIYSALEYATVAALHKSMNLSKAVQVKISDLRGSISLSDATAAKAQALSVAKSLAAGQDVYLDVKDMIENSKPDLSATQASLEMLNEKRSFYLGLPCSYITGELNSGLGDSGQADAKAIERGLKSYFVSIVKPICKALFGKELTFKSEDFQQIATSLEALKTFEITGEELMSKDNKTVIVNKLFGLPEDSKGDPAPEPVAPPVVPVVIPPAQPNPGVAK